MCQSPLREEAPQLEAAALSARHDAPGAARQAADAVERVDGAAALAAA